MLTRAGRGGSEGVLCRWRRRSGWALLASATVLAAGLSPVATATATASSPPRTCQAVTPGGPVFITTACVDPAFPRPYVDTNEPRTTTDPDTNVTVSYTYIHGGFTLLDGTPTNLRFSFYFPAKAQYKGRFFESTYPTVTQEDAAPQTIAFAISNGAYVVSTNNDGGANAAPVLAGYRPNAASAKYSRIVAAQVYKTSARPRGYIYGASGGAYQTLGAAEQTSGVWDGSVPMVPGTPNSIPSNFTIVQLALRVLHNKLPQIADAMAPGGSGNPYAGLNPEQRRTLLEVTRLGFPLRSWFQYSELNDARFSMFDGLINAIDSTYVNDFWTKPGYAGTDPLSPSVRADRIQFPATVVSLVGSPTSGLVLSGVPTGNLTGAQIDVTSGTAAGQSVPLGTVTGHTVGFGPGANPAVTNAIRVGDQVRIDNSAWLADQYYQRYQVPTPDMYGWNQYRDSSGNPPQTERPFLLGPLLAAAAGGSVADGQFHGKMIMLGSLLDIQAFPWSADWYKQQAKAFMGQQLLNDNYRLWYMDNAGHTPPPTTADAAHEVSYDGELQQALLYLDAWVTHGVEPPPNSNYHVHANTQVSLPAAAEARRGVQPVVTLSAKTAGTPASTGVIDVAVGQPVTFSTLAEVPPGAGRIVAAEFDPQGLGTFPVSVPLKHIGPEENLGETYSYSTPGTYFPVVRMTSNAKGDPDAPYGLVQNLASVRVVVH